MTLYLSALAMLVASAAEVPDDHRTEVKAPDEERGVWSVLPESLDEAGADGRELMDRLPGVTARSLGDAFSLATLQVRGAAAEHTRVFLDGVELNRADGAPVDIALLPLWNTGQIRVWPAHPPLGFGGGLGGAIVIDSPSRPVTGYGVRGEAGAFERWKTGLHAQTAGPHHAFTLGVVAEGSSGAFPWTDDGRTAFDSSDDLRRTRENNDARRFTGLVRASRQLGRCALKGVVHALDQEQGVPGPAGRLSKDARYALRSALGSLGLRCAGATWRARFGVGTRWMRASSEDAGAEVALVPTAAERDAVAPSVRGTVWWRAAEPVDLGFHQEVVHERYDLEDALRSSADRRDTRTRSGSAVAMRWRLPWLGLVFTPRLRLDGIDDGGAARTAVGWQALLRSRHWADAGLELTVGVSSATRFPNLFELVGDGLFVAAAEDLHDERGVTASTTLRWEHQGMPPGWRMALVWTGFASELDEVIQLRRNNLFQAVADNVGEATVLGSEVAVAFDLFRHLRFDGSATFLDTAMASEELALHGKPLPLRPQRSLYGRVTGYYDAPDGHAVATFGEVSHRGSYTYDLAGLAWAPEATELALGGRVEAETSGLLATVGRFGLEGRWMNLTDAATVDILGYPRPGRRWAVQLSWREEVF